MSIPQLLYKIGYAICHQLPERTFHFHDQSLPLCSRCTGIYLGVFIIFTFYFLFRYLKKQKPTIPPSLPISLVSVFFILLMVGNALSTSFGIPTSNTARFLTGILFGFTIPLFLIPAFNFSAKRQSDQGRIINLGEYFVLLITLAVISTLVLLKLDLVLYVAAYLSVLGLLLLWTLLNSTIIDLVIEKFGRKSLAVHLLLIIGLVLTAGELTFLYWLRLYLT